MLANDVFVKFDGGPEELAAISSLVQRALNSGRRVGVFTAPVDFRTAPIECLAAGEFVVGLDRPALRLNFGGFLFMLGMWEQFRRSMSMMRRSPQDMSGARDAVKVVTEFTREETERLYAPLRRAPGAMN